MVVWTQTVELCDRKLIEILLSDTNFLSVVGVFGYNPGLIREMDFRTELEGDGGFHEVRGKMSVTHLTVVERVHMNFRIQVIKDSVLSRSLPDCSVLMLEHMVNENNYHILSYISDTEEYWKSINELIRGKSKRLDGLGLLKAIIQLVRVTRPLDRLPQPRRDLFGAPSLFGTLITNLFGDGELFEALGIVLGSPDSNPKEIALAVDILNVLVFFQGPDRLRTYLASEGKCIAAPTSDKDRIAWTPESSLFTALLFVFERYESTRVQMFTLLREIFRVPLAHDDKFLSVLYPNYIHWLLQPLKSKTLVEDEPALFDLQDSIMELLTFCTESHGYRVKYLFGKQPIASYAEQMLRSKKKLFVIRKSFSTNLTALVEHIFTKFYETYKAECPLVFEAIRSRYESSFGSTDVAMDSAETDKVRFVQQNGLDEEEELYWEKDTDVTESFTPGLDDKNELSEVRWRLYALGVCVSEAAWPASVLIAIKSLLCSLQEEVLCRNRPRSIKLVDYADDEDEPTASLKEGDVEESPAPSSPRKNEKSPEEAEELKLPVREKKEDEVNTEAFLSGSSLVGQKKTHQKVSRKARSPQYKNMFQKISWKLSPPESNKASTSAPASSMASENGSESDNSSEGELDTNSVSVGPSHGRSGDSSGEEASAETNGEATALISAKRKLALDEAQSSESLLKKAKTCTPISSS
ncbi:hypothetical protein BBJ28_00002796 [Nothophytophthora sp. Chile5]|nr:hypothetical protein BBJ28_00002796 [Nothophytophthora sp. Chile5]